VVSWLGVGAVTRAVTGSPEPVIPAATIARQHPHLNVSLPASQLVAAPASPVTTTTEPVVVREPTPTVVVPATVVPAVHPESTTSVPTTQPPSGSKGSGSGSGTGTGQGGPPPVPYQATYTDQGGTITVTCTVNATNESVIAFALDSFAADPGFTGTVQSNGSSNGSEPAVVEFSDGTTNLLIGGQCGSNGEPVVVYPSGWGTNPPPDPGQF
jgi:hypothetical protein